jgi:hypothetical protein
MGYDGCSIYLKNGSRSELWDNISTARLVFITGGVAGRSAALVGATGEHST